MLIYNLNEEHRANIQEIIGALGKPNIENMGKVNIWEAIERKEALTNEIVDPWVLKRGEFRGKVYWIPIVDHDLTDSKQLWGLQLVYYMYDVHLNNRETRE